jgi:hypothetical protein
VQPSGISRDDFLSLVEAAILAPSADNVHPWSFDADDRFAEADEQPLLPKR